MGKFTEFKLPLKSMGQGKEEFHYHLDKQFFQNMESADIHGADLEVTLVVDHKGDAYNLNFHITGNVTLLCDRCLDSLIHEVDTTYEITVKYGDRYCDDSDTVLEIPESDNYLNVAYMLYDTVALTIPLKHVHPAGKCNKAMSNVLHKHRVTSASHEDSELTDTLIDEMDEMDSDDDNGGDNSNDAPTDPRWDALKGFNAGDNE